MQMEQYFSHSQLEEINKDINVTGSVVISVFESVFSLMDTDILHLELVDVDFLGASVSVKLTQ